MTQSDIINNNFSKAFECIKCSNAYDTGAVLYEEKLFKQLSERKRSTFDLSKFTVVGSPTITDDGIASGFIVNNYLSCDIPIRQGSTWEWIMKITTGDNTTGSSKHFLATDGGYGFSAKIDDTGHFVFYLSSNGTSNDIGILTNNNITVIPNTTYYIKFLFDGTRYVASYSTNNTTYIQIAQKNSTLSIYNEVSKRTIGNGYAPSGYIYPFIDGSIDLSQFSITVDGKEIFNGNKTGIDTITPDNYEVVGSPMISEGGIASGFSSSNYLTIQKLSSLVGSASSWELDMRFTTPNDITSSRVGWLFEGNTHWCNLIRIGGDGTNYTGIQVSLTSTGSSYDIASYKRVVHVTANTTYWLKLIFTGTEYLCKYSTNGTDFTTVNIATSSLKISDKSTLLNIGVSKTANHPFTGSIDLNAFKIYVDGNLVYQPCLKIPYTESKTGSKIVDVAYRDRVIDLYEQEGQAGYFTIDETNQNFTLPMGEIYGMIETLRSEIPTNNNQLINGAGYAKKEEIPTLVSELENDSNFATQTQVMQAIASIPQFKLSIVNELPTIGEKMTLYLIPKEGANNDIYNEYVWIEQTGSFEFLGSTAVDLSDYYTKEETNGLIPDITPLATKQELQGGLDTKQDKGNYALKSEIPTKTSQLINDNDFTSQNYISSMGENLVVNGTGLLRNNFNFTQFTFDSTDGVNSDGCFKYINSIRGSATTTIYMPFDGSQSYTLSYYVKNSELTKTSDFLNFFDMDEYSITSGCVVFVENTLMELTQPLKNGDTVVHVNDASKIVTTLNQTFNKGFIFWNYKSSSGFDYGVETYSRWFYYNLYSYENIDTINNTITLNSPWNGLNFEAGWKLSQSSSGGTYLYGNSHYISTPGVWEHKTFTFTKDKHFKGASYIKIGWLINYSDKENNEFKISNITLSSKQDIIPDLETIRAGASKGATALQSYTETDPIYTADKPNIALKSEIPTKVSSLTNDADYQTTTNLVTSVSSSSTNSQYPSAKCVYDIIGDIESLLAKV